MLRKFVYNKIFRTTCMLLLFLMLLLFPVSKKYSLEDDTSIKVLKETRKKEVYLIDRDGYVSRTKVDISFTTEEKYAKDLIELLIIGGKLESKIPNGFKAILPCDLRINNVIIKEDVITIDLSKEFYEIDKKNEDISMELITYNLTSINGIKKVFVTIEGKTLDKFKASGKRISQPLTRKDGVNKNYDVTNYKNVNTITVYYINKNNNDYYYVPVTKITNDNREKIKVIIDELASSYIYETNLMSFLNYNTKLLDYNLKDQVLTLNFNNFLFDDASSKSILEEVIYTISLSVRDNYDVNEVIFNVEGNEITKSVIKNIE